MSFVSVSLDDDPAQLLDDAVDSINANLDAAGYPGWKASDAALAVLILAACAQMAADAATYAATILPAVFRAFGTQLLGVPYQNAASAKVTSTWTFTGASPVGGYEIDQGTTVMVDGQPFYTQIDYVSNEGDTTATLTLVASQGGQVYNDLGGPSVGYPRVQLQTGIDYIASVITEGVTSGGEDQETDAEYQNRLVAELQLQAPRPVVASDYATFVQSDIAANVTGVAVGRATSIDGYYPDGRALSTGGAGSTALTATLTNTSKTVTYVGIGSQVPAIGATVTGTGIPGGTTVAVSPAPTDISFTLSAAATTSGSETLTISEFAGYGPEHLACSATLTSSSTSVTIVSGPFKGAIPEAGTRVTGTGIPPGATVAGSPDPTATGFTLSAAATANETGEQVTISSWTSVALANTTFVTDVSGNALTAADMDALEAFLETYRPTNWLINVQAPSYTTIYLSVLVKVLPGNDQTAVGTNVQAAILAWLNQGTWGNTLQTQSGQWLNSGDGFNVIRWKKAIQIAGDVAGVDYVDTLTIGTSPSPGGTSDIVMAGPAPLPLSSSGTIVVTTE